jgi:hypothetical protein
VFLAALILSAFLDPVPACFDPVSACLAPVPACSAYSAPVSACPAPVVPVRHQEVKSAGSDADEVKLMKSTSVQRAGSDDDEVKMKIMKCEMPLCDEKDSCAYCAQNGPLEDCPKGHMILCQSPDVCVACDFCDRALCSKHVVGCYCSKRLAENRLSPLKNFSSQSSSSSVKKPLLKPPRHSITKKTTRGTREAADA